MQKIDSLIRSDSTIRIKDYDQMRKDFSNDFTIMLKDRSGAEYYTIGMYIDSTFHATHPNTGRFALIQVTNRSNSLGTRKTLTDDEVERYTSKFELLFLDRLDMNYTSQYDLN